MKCEYCGYEIKNGSKFCSKCGKRIVIQPKDTKLEMVYQITTPQYNPESSIVIETGKVLIGNITKKVVLECVLKNLSSQVIQMIKVQINQIDPLENILDPIEYDLIQSDSYSFGKGTSILLNENTRRIEIQVMSIIYEDGSSIEVKDSSWIEIPSQTLLEDQLSSKAYKQYCNEFAQARYIPATFQDIKQCTCGNQYLSSIKNCPICGNEFDYLLDRLDSPILEKEYDYQEACRLMGAPGLENELAAKELFEGLGDYKDANELVEKCQIEYDLLEKQLAKDKELSVQTKRKKNMRKILLAIIAVAILIGLIIFAPKLELAMKYHKANSYLNKGEYDQAITLFEDLEDYKESQDLILESKYQKANSLVQKEEYNEAIQLYSILINYKDSKDLKKEAIYNGAYQLYEDKDYLAAMTYFGNIKGYKDADTMITKSTYNYACKLMDTGDYEKAVSMFNKVVGYLDAEEMKKEAKLQYCKKYGTSEQQEHISQVHQYIKDLIKDNYSGAQELFNQLYGWSASILVNDGVSSVRWNEYTNVDVTFSGGEPGESKEFCVQITFPNGETSLSCNDWVNVYDGGSFGFYWDTGCMTGPTTGYLTLKVYDRNWTCYASASIYVYQ